MFFKQRISTVLSVLMIASSSSAWSADLPGSATLSKQAAEQFRRGNLQEAVALQEKAVSEKPKDWLAHSALSFYNWQQGNILKATEEGQIAVELSPRNYVALTNLALIKEGLEDLAGAIPLYEAAGKISPDKWVPFLGKARCQNKLGQAEAGLATMQEMGTKTGKDFAWYYELADTYLRLNKPQLALGAVEKAKALASEPEQKAASAIQSMLVYLQTDQFDKARELKEQVFDKFAPKDQELYVRTAVSLLPAANPKDATSLLNSALKNLVTEEDAEAFYRLGKAFEAKANDDASADKSTSNVWLDTAATAFKRANQLASDRPKYCLALAAVFDEQGKSKELEAELNKVKLLQNWDTLAPFLLSELSKSKTGGTSQSPGHCSSSLDKVTIKVGGLNCGCHMSKVTEALNQIDGVAYVHIPTNVQPYEGIMLIDQSRSSVNTAFAKATEKTIAIYASMKPPVIPEFTAVSITKLGSAAKAIEAAQLIEYGSITSFYNAFKAVVPFEPVQELAADPNSEGTL